MPGIKPTKTSNPLPSLPREYDRLLQEYVGLLEKTFPNPYELSTRERLREWFDLGWQIRYVRSRSSTNFVKTPNTLAQELPGAPEMLQQLEKFNDEALRTLAEMNNMNLSRLRRRSITDAITPGLALIGSILGLLPALQSIFPISINDALISWLPQVTISLILKILIVISLLLGLGNRMVTIPRIGIVDALGGILKIAMTYRNMK